MNETFKAWLCPEWTVTDEMVTVGKSSILYDDFESFKFTKWNNSGVVKANGTSYYLTFAQKDKERAMEAIKFIEKKFADVVEKRKREAIENPMRTGQGMYDYSLEHGFGVGFLKSTGKKHFEVLAKNLLPNETPIMTFIGWHNMKKVASHEYTYAYALTNKRIIMGQWKLTGENFKSIKIENINDITYQKRLLQGIITIDTYKETFSVGLDNKYSQNVNKALNEEFDKLKDKMNNSSNSQTNTQTTSAIDEIRKFKQLLDEGIITQEEFNSKKKELLGL